MSAKYIFVTGGVLSGLGKGIVAASIGNLLKSRGYCVLAQKFDPYLNVDAGTLNPAEHGECFVTADGAEADLDLGHYERFLDTELTRDSSVMSGSIYQSVIEQERRGKYLGKTLQVIPHVTDEVKARLYGAAKRQRAQIVIAEIGGTVGDIESPHFIEAIRQVALERPKDVAFVHLGFLPYLEASHEIKTKPIQNSVNDLRERGIHPDLVICRADQPVLQAHLDKVALFAGLPAQSVIPLATLDTIYAAPLELSKYKVDQLLLKRLGLKAGRVRLGQWRRLVKRIRRNHQRTVRIGVVGKYLTMTDTYFSVMEALRAASWTTVFHLEIEMIDGETLEKDLDHAQLERLDGICVPGGFGKRGIEGLIKAIALTRRRQIPYFGLCLGMQLAVIEFARAALGLKRANSTEFAATKDPVIDLMSEQVKKMLESRLGGSMRLGSFLCELAAGSKAASAYGKRRILERHRHRYEFNNRYRQVFLRSGEWLFSGVNPELGLVEIVELKSHPYFLGCQFHPEFKSRPNRPHPLFRSFLEAAVERAVLRERSQAGGVVGGRLSLVPTRNRAGQTL